MKPLMSKREIKIIENELVSCFRRKGFVSVLEWGSGGSTVYFTRFMKQKNIPYVWRSVEYNKGWYEKIKNEVINDLSTKLVLFDVGNNNLRQRYVDMEEYINYPKTLGERFDVVIVDGRKRRRCVIESLELLNTGGCVFLHDAQRKHYQCSFGYFPNSVFVTVHMWRGRLEQIGFIKQMGNHIISSVYRFLSRCMVYPYQVITGHLRLKTASTRKLIYSVSGIVSKLRILAMIFVLGFKKRGISVVYKTRVHLSQGGTRVISSAYYMDATDFRDALVKKE